MKADEENIQRRNGHPPTKTMACGDIQALLYDYLTHEIGRARSELIREHIRKCTACHAAAADVQATINLLKDASSDGPGGPVSLSEDRRKRVWRAFMHPFLDWLYGHHIIVSIVIAIVAVVITLLVIRSVKIIWKVREDTDSVQNPRALIDITPTNTAGGQGWYMIRGEDGQNWFYHPDRVRDRTREAETGR